MKTMAADRLIHSLIVACQSAGSRVSLAAPSGASLVSGGFTAITGPC